MPYLYIFLYWVDKKHQMGGYFRYSSQRRNSNFLPQFILPINYPPPYNCYKIWECKYFAMSKIYLFRQIKVQKSTPTPLLPIQGICSCAIFFTSPLTFLISLVANATDCLPLTTLKQTKSTIMEIWMRKQVD